MTENLPPQALLLQAAEQKQGQAADPNVSAWVRANAGTGKTHVLVQRILRLLLAGAAPRSILCLTFTKNAAAEMEARVLDKLGVWATADDDKLKASLGALLGRAPAPAEFETARCLFATVIDAPGGLATMTLHSFCERVLRRYSFEANVPAGFAVLTEEEAREALREATASAFASTDGELRDAFSAIVAYAGEEEFGRVLQAMLGQRNTLAHLFRLSEQSDPIADVRQRLRKLFGLAATDTREGLLRDAAAVLDKGSIERAIELLSSGSANDQEGAKRFRAVAVAPNDEARFAALREAFLTGKGEPRKSLMTAPTKKKAGALSDALTDAQDAFVVLDQKLCGLRVAEATEALLRLTAAIFEHYEGEKRTRGTLDFDDLIGKTLNLLMRQDAAEWVLYELDARIDHILVDEAQDTSPEQWAILQRLTSDFFAGVSARETVPTIFAVGDEKQSIYGFQGAAPELLTANGAYYEQLVQEAGFSWRPIDLDLSFRTLDPILTAVDGVCGDLPGMRGGALVPHIAYRRGGGGFVEIWEPERGERQDKTSVWEPETEAEPKPKPAEALAKRIAEQIRHWLDSGEMLASCGRPIEPGDILILLRKREPMAALLQAALKQAGVPVAGADRVALLDTLAVMDLLALADALLLPDDDLQLAAALKSPLFGLSDDDLFRLAYNRPGSLWQSLQEAAEGDASLAAMAAKLKRWRALAFSAPPADFLAHILEGEGGREAFGARLGTQCYDALSELLALAEDFGSRGEGSLSEFLAFVRESASEVKRETDQAAREVRIMTVHGAKGLEANIVILADTCRRADGKPPPIFLVDDESGKPWLPIWAVKGASTLPPIAEAKELRIAADERELGRLLYVAMTRARDRLYVGGFHNGALPDDCWHGTVQRSLTPLLSEAEDFAGRKVWRMGAEESAVAQSAALGAGQTEPPHPLLPPFDPLPGKEIGIPVLAPSRLLPLPGAQSEGSDAEGTFPRDSARAQGNLIHRLLEILPSLAPDYRASAAEIIASAFASDLSRGSLREAIGSAFAVLENPVLRWLFEGGHAEAGLAARLEGGDGPAIIAGQADRIFADEASVTIIDYKSGRFSQGEKPPRAYFAQLAAYRVALQRIYPESEITAALLNTRSRTLAHADVRDLDAVLAELGAE
jgi:ATP-dependent helicase/nuclease subunit A